MSAINSFSKDAFILQWFKKGGDQELPLLTEVKPWTNRKRKNESIACKEGKTYLQQSSEFQLSPPIHSEYKSKRYLDREFFEGKQLVLRSSEKTCTLVSEFLSDGGLKFVTPLLSTIKFLGDDYQITLNGEGQQWVCIQLKIAMVASKNIICKPEKPILHSKPSLPAKQTIPPTVLLPESYILYKPNVPSISDHLKSLSETLARESLDSKEHNAFSILSKNFALSSAPSLLLELPKDKSIESESPPSKMKISELLSEDSDKKEFKKLKT